MVLIDHGTEPIDQGMLPKDLKYIRSSPDKWWTGAMNDGICFLLDELNVSDEDYIVFQNDDVWFSPTLVSDLVATSKMCGDAVVGPVTLDEENGLIMDADNHFSILRAKTFVRTKAKPSTTCRASLLPVTS